MKNIVTVNGKEVMYKQLANGIFIEKDAYEDQTPINGTLFNASYCKYSDGFRWKVEYRKHIARALNRNPHVCWYKTRLEAINHINEIEKLL